MNASGRSCVQGTVLFHRGENETWKGGQVIHIGRSLTHVSIVTEPSIYFKFTSGAVRENLGRKGMHGHLPSAPGNQPLFIGAGPGFKTKTSPVSVRNIDVAPTAARLLNLSWPGATDGRVLQDILQ